MTKNLFSWLFHPDTFDRGLREKRHTPRYDDAGWLRVQAGRPWDTYAKEFRAYDGIGWFRTTVRLPRKPRLARLRFEGAGYHARVWVNGRLVGEHAGPYVPFSFRIEQMLKAGRNTIAVRIHNTYSAETIPIRRTDWLKYGGLTRPVSLETADGPVFERATATIAGSDRFPILTARGRIEVPRGARARGPLRVLAAIRARPGGPILARSAGVVRGAAFSIPIPVARLPRWSVDHPRLVHLEVTLKDTGDRTLARHSLRTGIRTIRWDGARLRINGQPVWLRGVNMVEEYPDWTCSPGDASIRARIRDLKRNLHGNFFRAAHYPHHPRFLDLADEMGLLVLDEIPMCYLPAGADTLARGTALADAMQWRDAHHPSVLLWSAGNERPSNVPATAREIVGLARHLKAFDSGRPVTCVSNHGSHDSTLSALDVLCMNDYTGVWGKPFAATTAVMPAVARALSRNLDAIHRLHPDKPIVVSEFGGPVFPVGGTRFGSLKWQAAQIGTFMRVMATKPYVAGAAAWCYTDQRINGASHYPAGALGTNVLEVFGLKTLAGRPRPSFHVLAAAYHRLALRKVVT